MRFFIKIGLILLLVTTSGVVYAGNVMREECKTRYDELKRAQTDAQHDYIRAKKSLRTKLGKMDSQQEANTWEKNNERLTDDYNNRVEDIKQEMESLNNDPNCWK
jgi:gas vesicle protein